MLGWSGWNNWALELRSDNHRGACKALQGGIVQRADIELRCSGGCVFEWAERMRRHN